MRRPIMWKEFQVDLFIQAPQAIKIERDELEAGIKTKRRKPQFIGVMS